MELTGRYRLAKGVQVRREQFGGLVYRYDATSRGRLFFLKSPLAVDILLALEGEPRSALAETLAGVARLSTNDQQKLLALLDGLAAQGFIEAIPPPADVTAGPAESAGQ